MCPNWEIWYANIPSGSPDFEHTARDVKLSDKLSLATSPCSLNLKRRCHCEIVARISTSFQPRLSKLLFETIILGRVKKIADYYNELFLYDLIGSNCQRLKEVAHFDLLRYGPIRTMVFGPKQTAPTSSLMHVGKIAP
jgi:hypothetical protein